MSMSARWTRWTPTGSSTGPHEQLREDQASFAPGDREYNKLGALLMDDV
jgi:hypothetical protein